MAQLTSLPLTETQAWQISLDGSGVSYLLLGTTIALAFVVWLMTRKRGN